MWVGDAPPRLYAYTGGRSFDAARPAIVFLHGAQSDHSVWILQSRYLAHHGWSVLAFDLPGHGRSEGKAATRVEDIADTVAGVLSTLRLARVLVAGHSMGSLLALEVGRRLGGTPLAGVALLGTSFPMRVSDALLDAARDDPPAAMRMINAWSHRPGLAAFAPRPGCPGPGFNVVVQNLRLMERIEQLNGRDVLENDFTACAAYHGGIEAIRALACPALFVLGAADQMTPPRAARGLIDACADPTVETLPLAGHAMMSEDPDGVRRALLRFAMRVMPAG
ncbi:MAG TPA: alpha/beta hydrolase [Burkholderiaceae bacterium]|nr:alpha/beta hydrolase [Burkholderiaceae bacterium]